MRDTDGSNGNGGWSAPDTAVGKACHRLFNELTGSARPPQADFRRLLVAPTNMLDRFLALIAREADHARRGEGRGARIRRSEEHTSELQSRPHLVCRLLLENKKASAGTM